MIYGKRYNDFLINPEFERLQITFTEEEYHRLVDDILSNGVRKTLKTWNGYIIDGHKRFRICTKYGVPYTTSNCSFFSKWEVFEWICSENLSKSDLTKNYKRYYLGKQLLLCLDLSGRGFVATNEGSRVKGQMADELGESSGCTRETILKYSSYALAIDAIYENEPKIAEAILTEKVLLAYSSVLKISQLPADELNLIRDSILEKNHERMQMSDVWHELRWKRAYTAAPEKQKKPAVKPMIKQMPEFDPDAELSSLSLTIPSWKGSLDRICEVSNFEIATEEAKTRLEEQIEALSGSLFALLNMLRENHHE